MGGGGRRTEEETWSNMEKVSDIRHKSSAPPPPHIRLILRLSLVANNVSQ